MKCDWSIQLWRIVIACCCSQFSSTQLLNLQLPVSQNYLWQQSQKEGMWTCWFISEMLFSNFWMLHFSIDYLILFTFCLKIFILQPQLIKYKSPSRALSQLLLCLHKAIKYCDGWELECFKNQSAISVYDLWQWSLTGGPGAGCCCVLTLDRKNAKYSLDVIKFNFCI